MGRRAKSEPDPAQTKRAPATTPEARENQMISLAVEMAEHQMRTGTASSQVIVHYLKLGSTREKLEQERLKQENEMLRAKTEALASAKHVEELYKTALDAMRAYSGDGTVPQEDE